MQDFKNKVAVITGGGSGIGEGIVKRCIQEQMRVAIADINPQNLDKLRNELNNTADLNNLLFIKTDVSNKEEVLRLAEKTKKKFGQIDLLFNNAGIPGPIGSIWDATYDEIEQVVKVNLLGMMYILKAFVPIMLTQNTPGHIVNTSSGAGLQFSFDMACYVTTKRAVIALSETLSLDLYAVKSKLNVSVLCPGLVSTNFVETIKLTHSDSDSAKKLKYFFRENLKSRGMPVIEVVDKTFEAIKNNKFYILTHFDQHCENIRTITSNMLAGKNPIDFFKKQNV